MFTWHYKCESRNMFINHRSHRVLVASFSSCHTCDRADKNWPYSVVAYCGCAREDERKKCVVHTMCATENVCASTAN